MDFKEAVRTCLRKTLTLSGRASLSEFWWFVLFVNLTGLALLALPFLVTGEFGYHPRRRGIFATMIPTVVVMAVSFVLIIAVFTVQVRRFHDVGLTGWWVIWGTLASNIPSVGWLAIVAMIIVSLLNGTERENRHGPAPLRVEGG